MEKKQNTRSSQVQTKSQNIDSKKQDASGSKIWPRSNKKRESPSSGTTKSDVSRKPVSQKGKSFDKRPKPRGSYHGGVLGGKPEPRLEDGEAEVGSVFLPGSKKQNLNHLLNFNYAPREGGYQGASNRKPHGLVYTNTHKHSKELFLQSNCQFVVNASGDYSPYLVDPDIPVNWELIEQINVRVNEPLSCPICLGEAVAGKITPCGHTYCWPCLLHYFALSEDSSRPCPICFQLIDKRHLKSVQGVWQDWFPVGGVIRMKLMRRLRGSTFVEPAPPLVSFSPSSINSSKQQLLSISEKHHSTLFSKLLTASSNEIMQIIERERGELSKLLEVESDNPEYCFINQALNLLQQRESRILPLQLQSSEPLSIVNTKATAPSFNSITQQSSGGLSFLDDFQVLSVKDQQEETAQPSLENGLNPDAPIFDMEGCSTSDAVPHKLDAVKKPDDDDLSKFFYFYQAADGQTTFLHALDVHILESSWGSISKAPRELRGLVLKRASGSVGADSRKRLRCLQHLPIHCPYDLVEIHLEPPYVTSEALKMFKGDLEERKRERQRRARDEKRRERVICQQEQLLMGHLPSLKLNIHSEEHFPAYQPQIEPSPPSNDWHWDERYDDNISTAGSSSFGEQSLGLSFAKMASGSGNWGIRPTYNNNPATSAGPSVASVRHRNDSESSDSNAGAPPSYNISLSEAIDTAMLNNFSSYEEPHTNGKAGKKKKQKPKVLFTTGIQHRTKID